MSHSGKVQMLHSQPLPSPEGDSRSDHHHARSRSPKTLHAVVDRMLRVGQAARRLGISRREIERLVGRYEDEGSSGFVSGKSGPPTNHQLPPGLAEHTIALIRERSAYFGPTPATEKLRNTMASF